MKRIPVAAMAFLASFAVQADVSVSKIFGSHMVVQRDRPVPVWGKAAPGEAVRVSFAGQAVSAMADAEGFWQTALKPLALSKEGRDLVVAGPSNTNVFTDVLVGDVWLCSGQSNMEMPFVWGVCDGKKFKEESVRFPLVRHFKVGRNQPPDAPEPYELPVAYPWNMVSNDFDNITTTGYFFARRLALELDIPIGIVCDAWSASRIEPFIPSEGWRAVPALAGYARRFEERDASTERGREALSALARDVRKWADEAEAAVARGERPATQPPRMKPLDGFASRYNGMIAPLTRFAIKGVIWYQGCSNGQDKDYDHKMEGLILGWRKVWGYDFPFYFVQLASVGVYYGHFPESPGGGTGLSDIREAQRKALRIPNTGMAVAIDVGDPYDIHPKAKTVVGERLALWALAKDYGKDIVFSGPLVKTAVRETDGDGKARVRVSFDYVGSGLMSGSKNWKDNEPAVENTAAKGAVKGFSLLNSNNRWEWADAVIDGNDVLVSSTNAPNPVAIRYAFRSCPLPVEEWAGLYNREGLPASPFHLAVSKPAAEAADTAKAAETAK